MQKIKFQIKGMHCNSCALLIEEKLKNQPGIIRAKVNYDSQKAAIIYDEEKFEENNIRRLIKETGDYQLEEIKEAAEGDDEGRKNDYDERFAPRQNHPSLRNPFWIGVLTGFTVISLIFNVVLVTSPLKLPSVQAGNIKNNGTIQDTPSPQNPSAQPPSPSQKPSIQTFEITKDNHIRGAFDASVTLVEFSDFECPFCERHYPTLNKILSDYQGKVRLVYKHFPLSFHPNSQKAAEASECANEQGKFWQYHDKLFENQTSGFSLDKFKQWAKDLKLNTNKFNDCLDSSKYAQKVQADYQEGASKSVNGTPATFVNGQLVSGALPYESFKQIIDQVISNL